MIYCPAQKVKQRQWPNCFSRKGRSAPQLLILLSTGTCRPFICFSETKMVSVWHRLRQSNTWLQHSLWKSNSVVVMSLRIETVVGAQESSHRNLANHVTQVHALQQTRNKFQDNKQISREWWGSGATHPQLYNKCSTITYKALCALCRLNFA